MAASFGRMRIKPQLSEIRVPDETPAQRGGTKSPTNADYRLGPIVPPRSRLTETGTPEAFARLQFAGEGSLTSGERTLTESKNPLTKLR